MSTGLIIALIVIAAVVIIAAVMTLRARGPRQGPSLKRRFGPEYDRAVARHDGDAKAAERELTERVQRHGELRERPLEPAQREQYEARWTAAQERFVDSPRDAVAEADRLLAELAGARGFPDGGQYEEQLSALSVHHAHHVDGYRRVHRAAHLRAEDARDGGQGTEDMREAMVAARALFEELVKPARHDGGGHTGGRHDHGRERAALDGGRKAPTRGGHMPWAMNRRQAKES
ncbi:hypothetical protein ACFYN9_04030 [Streptomyces collinus]|uniref:Secreted protein n=1 Tax=Streptomyces violaceochromogenes TaxID=67377 RepID=A0ABU6LVU5_9ACTN|nr:hypothetical protein [Streptomyces violaceochromogenes]MEC7053627.1 hypothetical protein [Streptomyces violaceochromogenes]GHC60013.1 hypothetical protein GCM10010309_20580 [Streptomyces violaceochromogenes]